VLPDERAVRFIGNLTHTGDFSGEPFKLRPWQEKPVRQIFGTIRPDGLRQYRRVFMALPRKQGKTELAAAMLLYLLLGQGKTGQSIYSASGDRAQAALIFRAAAQMIRNDKRLSQLCLVYDGYKRIEFQPAGNTYEALSSDAPLKHGLGPSAVLFDELHVLPNRELFRVLTTGFGARREPLTICITTAGWDRHSLCYEQWQYAERVRDGLIKDSTFLPVIWAAKPEDDWTAEKTWRKAMPALGDFCSLEFIEDECRRAKELPREENTFRQLFLNQWTQQATRWLSIERWSNLAGEINPAELAGAPCFAGLDLSQTRDLSAVALVWVKPDQTFKVMFRFWAPEDGIWRKEPGNDELYEEWARQGFLTLTPGEVIDYQRIEEDLVELFRGQDLRGLWADKQGALQLCLRLRDVHGIPGVQFLTQNYLNLNDPARELERRILAGTMEHDGNPVAAYCVGNAVIRTNSTGLILPDKAQATGRIDGVAALIDAIGGIRLSGDLTNSGTSPYVERGVFFVP
jgi:phage terminase large subunit-like protein